MPKKVMFCATVDTHFESFHLPYLKWFKEQGWEVHVAANGDIPLPYVDQKFNISIERSPFSLKNITAYKELKEIIDKNEYDIIHCHTPMGGVISRMAAKEARNIGTKLIYTAHGFHFFKGAPLINWAFYYPIEKFLSKYTDCLITINKEDYHQALKHRFNAEHIKHIHGVGINIDVFFPVNQLKKNILKDHYGYSKQDILLFYAAEFNKNKNQQYLIKTLALIKKQASNVRLLLAGDGPLLEDCKKLAINLGVGEMVHFLGYRSDIDKLLKMSDIAVASSLREGLPVNIMEAMASGLAVIATDNRGHRELIQNGENGWIVSTNGVQEMSDKIKLLIKNEKLRSGFGKQARKVIEENYAISNVLNEKSQLYSLFMEDKEEKRWAVH
ncbi:glycosyltransferase family 4 protein [Bacillus sp. USDA818B3_A]|uniref:glycosyltransferase family 4 protein n=1 Tax=Bacillus sp. USDA818B3_A TaxID=2698834 RepID=UPI001370FA67|nr:glycosyltransferase family 4 protein [Bacillus sp. USDA818B3_A]